MFNVFSEEFAARIIRAVDYVEELMRSSGLIGGSSRADGVFLPVKLSARMDHDAGVDATVLIPGTSAPYALTTSGQTVKVYPWKIPSDKHIPSDFECWAFWWGGKLYAVVPEDCFQDD